jgi:peptidoglycan/xylan/chitin deacetylase (PgdA/CDA1 family)
MISRLKGAVKRRAERLVHARAPVILMYHRVTSLPADPWALAVSPANFAEQMEALCRVRRVVPLDSLDPAAPAARGDKPLAVITFDDGYRDFATDAAPIMARYGCPATIFVTTGLVGKPHGFWWDQLARIVLETPALPPTLAAGNGASRREWTAGAGLQSPAREALYRDIWSALYAMDGAARDRAIAGMAKAAGVRLETTENRAMDPNEIASLPQELFTVGAHTVTHPALSQLSPELQSTEIETSRSMCAELTGREPEAFAYPFGDYDDVTVDLVRNAGFARAVTVNEARVRRSADPFQLPRINVGDWDGDRLLKAI